MQTLDCVVVDFAPVILRPRLGRSGASRLRKREREERRERGRRVSRQDRVGETAPSELGELLSGLHIFETIECSPMAGRWLGINGLAAPVSADYDTGTSERTAAIAEVRSATPSAR